MKRYWLFIGHSYCPEGGMRDFHSSHSTPRDAENTFYDNIDLYDIPWYQIYDSQKQSIINQGTMSNTGSKIENKSEYKIEES